jgi:hypothetical protein
MGAWMVGCAYSIVTVSPLLNVSSVVEPSAAAVTLIVAVSPAFVRDPVSGLTVKPDPPGTLIVNVTGPPSAISWNDPEKPAAMSIGSSVTVDGVSVSVPAGGGVGELDLVGEGVGLGFFVLVGGGAALLGFAEAVGDGVAVPLAGGRVGDGDGLEPVGAPSATGALADGPALVALCAAALDGPPPCRIIAAAIAPPARMTTSAATAA